MLSMEKIADIASTLGRPEDVLFDALKRYIVMRIVEFEGVVKRMEEKYGVIFEQFEDRDMLSKLGHSWEVEQDYYDWDRAVTELGKFKEILKRWNEKEHARFSNCKVASKFGWIWKRGWMEHLRGRLSEIEWQILELEETVDVLRRKYGVVWEAFSKSFLFKILHE